MVGAHDLGFRSNGIHDSLQTEVGTVWVGLSYDHTPTLEDQNRLSDLGYTPKWVIPAVDAILIGAVDALNVTELSQIEGSSWSSDMVRFNSTETSKPWR